MFAPMAVPTSQVAESAAKTVLISDDFWNCLQRISLSNGLKTAEPNRMRGWFQQIIVQFNVQALRNAQSPRG